MISLFNKKSFKCSAAGMAILISLGCILLTNGKNALANTASSASQSSEPTSLAASQRKPLVAATDIEKSGLKGKIFKGKMIIVSDPRKIVVGYSLQGSKADKTTSEIAKEQNAIAAVNAGRFNFDTSPSGFIIKDGKVVYSDLKQEDLIINAVGFTKDGVLIVGQYTIKQLMEMEIKDAVEYMVPALIKDGKPNTELYKLLDVNPRTAIGQKKDGTVVLLVIDGRSNASIGATVKDVSDILLENDVVNASLLDGGSSSTMYYNGKIINHPCAEGEKERIVPSAFLVVP